MATRPALGVILVLILLAIAFLAGKQFAPVPQPSPTPTTEEPTPTPEPIISESGNIIVSSPKPAEKISSPLVLEGEARVFENVVDYRLRDTNGNILVEGFASAQSPDIGEFGPFRAEIEFPKPEGELGILEVFSTSPKDGSEINKVIIPIKFK